MIILYLILIWKLYLFISIKSQLQLWIVKWITKFNFMAKWKSKLSLMPSLV